MAPTLPRAPLRIELADLFGATTGANDLAVCPSPYRYVINTVILIREIDDSLLEASRFGLHCVFHDQNIAEIVGRVKVINAFIFLA
jgi:hypothetical protein